jgi:predicted lactoylglutathione lyase
MFIEKSKNSRFDLIGKKANSKFQNRSVTSEVTASKITIRGTPHARFRVFHLYINFTIFRI